MHYETVSQAIAELRKRGFTYDFNLEENCITCHPEKFSPGEFEIVDTYRYEGTTDPADEAIVYGIESHSGIKGVLVTSYGAYSDIMSDEMIKKLQFRK